jgi:hypothetical protein
MIEHFKISNKGIELYSQVTIIAGSDIPGGTTDTDNVQIGSMYLRTNGKVYTKTTAGAPGVWAQVQTVSLPYDLAFYIPTNPYLTSSIVTGFLSPRTMTITSGSSNVAKCSIAATTTTTTFIIGLNGSQIATATFTASNTIGLISFTAGSTINISAGDVLTISTSDTVDATIAGIGITLVGISSIS